MLGPFGGCGTRFAQTVLAVSPNGPVLLGHAKGAQIHFVISWIEKSKVLSFNLILK